MRVIRYRDLALLCLGSIGVGFAFCLVGWASPEWEAAKTSSTLALLAVSLFFTERR